jgi:hypothetical protein
MLKNIWEKIKIWLNENQVQSTWFLIGILFSDLVTNIGRLDFSLMFWDVIVIVLLYVTRNTKLQ